MRTRPLGAVEKKPARKAQRPTGPVFHGLTPAELAFREAAAGIEVRPGWWETNPTYAVWCQQARERWEAANVLWFWGRDADGHSVWSSMRPTPKVVAQLKLAGEHYWMHRPAWEAEQARIPDGGSRLIPVKRID
jgi:hypothetical protein